MLKHNLERFLPFVLIFMTFQSIAPWLNLKIPFSWFITWAMEMLLIYMFLSSYLRNKLIRQYIWPFSLTLFILIVIISLLYGIFFMAEDYNDKVAAIKHFAHYMLCLGILYFQDPQNIIKISSQWTKYALPCVVFFIPFMQGEAIGHYFAPFAYFVIFTSFIGGKKRFKIYLVLALIIMFGALGARSVMIRFIMGALLAIAIFYKNIIPKKLLLFISTTFLFAPFLFLWLAIYTDFNIFQIQEYFNIKDVELAEGFDDKSGRTSALVDTRTFIYSEVIYSAIYNNYVLEGRSLARGNDTYSEMYLNEDEHNIHDERRQNEARILNEFTYMGVIGILIILSLIISSVYYAFKYGNSSIMYFVGLYVTFRWFYSWIEDFEFFDLNNLYLWIPMAMCFSPHFLEMSDDDFKEWASNLI